MLGVEGVVSMSEIITARDIYVRPIKEPSYFEMHLMLTEKLRLEREKEILVKRIVQLDQKVCQLAKNLKAMKKIINQQEDKKGW